MGGQPKKKWTHSKANNYVSRVKACRKLQISLPFFRRLCILKGIYPHDPKKKHKKYGTKHVYYHVKDMKYLRREPILWKYRQQQTYQKKIQRYKGKHDWDQVKRMSQKIPQVNLDHLIRERYPRFSNALQDLDDPLTMIHTFGCLASGMIPNLTASARIQCQRLTKEFQNYVAECGLLRKVFVSVKGMYYQARFRKKYDVTWIVPHQFAYHKPKDVDFGVMCTFLEFYLVLLKFVNYRLYLKSKMRYPPFGEIDYDLTSMSLTKLRQRGKCIYGNKSNAEGKKKKQKKQEKEEQNEFEDAGDANLDNGKGKQLVKVDLSEFANASIDATAAVTIANASNTEVEEKVKSDDDEMAMESTQSNKAKKKEKESAKPNLLFKDLKFLLNRETPQFSLEFVILSMGGEVVFDQDCASDLQRKHPSITHEVIDRPIQENAKLGTREYIQPQWVYDCVNAGCIVPVEHYQPGVQCPPHLSPFVNYDEHHHKPSQAFVIEHWQELAKEYNGRVPLAKNSNKNKKATVSSAMQIDEQNVENDNTNTNTNTNEANNETGLDLSDWVGDGVVMKEKEKDNANKTGDSPQPELETEPDVTKEAVNSGTQKSEEEMLRQQRLDIAKQRRQKKKQHEEMVVEKTREETEREMLAKTFMSNRSKRFYNQSTQKEKRKNAYWDKIEKKRATLETE